MFTVRQNVDSLHYTQDDKTKLIKMNKTLVLFIAKKNTYCPSDAYHYNSSG